MLEGRNPFDAVYLLNEYTVFVRRHTLLHPPGTRRCVRIIVSQQGRYLRDVIHMRISAKSYPPFLSIHSTGFIRLPEEILI